MSSTGSAKRYIGIDLGTTFSAMAYLDTHGTPVTIPNAEGTLITPSVVLFESDGEIVVGSEAKKAAITDPELVVECVKREMGERYFSRPINGRKIPPPAVSALILKKIKQDAEAKIGPVAGAVITVPAYFNEGRRQATIAAGQIAGLEVLDILNEPTAAALAYAYRDFLRKGDGLDDVMRLADEEAPAHTAVVYDLGGGTFDVTVLKIQGKDLTVLATDGDVRLGGKDWDERIANAVADAFKAKFGADPRSDQHSYNQLMANAEDAKRHLTARTRTRLGVTHQGQNTTVELTREKFEELTADLLYRTENRLSRVIKASGLNWNQIDQVLTVGGSTRMPQVQAMLARVCGKQPNTSLAPDEVVAHGAAIHAAIAQLQRRSQIEAAKTETAKPKPAAKPQAPKPAAPKVDASSETLPMLDDADALPMPAEAASSSGLQQGLAPDPAGETIATLGEDDLVETVEGQDVPMADLAAVGEGGDPSELFDDNDATDVLRAINTTNVNAHSLGVIMTLPDGKKVNSIILPRNTALPTSVTKRYGTVKPNQTAVTVVVVEGESETPSECVPIGSCQIEKLPWGLRKGSTIYVTFSYDASGRLDVKASEATSGATAATTIDRANAMNKQEIAKAKEAVAGMKVS